jgi:hypothetical protein
MSLSLIKNELAKFLGTNANSFRTPFNVRPDSGVDFFTSEVSAHETYPSISHVSRFDQNDGWSSNSLRAAVPSYHDSILTDKFTADSADQASGSANAEMQQEAAPSDPVRLDRIGEKIREDMSSEQNNLSGGLTSGLDHIGVEDANMDGPDDLPDLLDYLPQAPVEPKPEQPAQGGIDDNTSASAGIPATVINDTEKSDFQGDLGEDTAVQSAFQTFTSNLDEKQYISPFLPLPIAQPSERKTSINDKNTGVDSNLNSDTIDYVNNKFKQFEVSTLSNMKRYDDAHKSLKNIQHEIMSIDNIVHFKDQILTPAEKQNKARDRIQRLEGTKKLLETTLLGLTTEDSAPIASLVAMHLSCTTMSNVLEDWIHNPDSDEPLQNIEDILSPSNTFNMIAMEKAFARYINSVQSSFIAYRDVIDSYRDSDRCERDISKVLKYDTDLDSPSYNKFTLHMKQMYNQQISSSLAQQRKQRSQLKAFTTLSNINNRRASNLISVHDNVKQSVNTAFINTDNVKQKTPKAPFNVKTNSRRLNLLESPFAKNKHSVSYVNEYDRTKQLFS